MALDVLVLRDPRESQRKCSLTPLRKLPGFRFVDYAPDRRLDAGSRLLLSPDGDELSLEDRDAPLLLVDCCWRRVPDLLRTIDGDGPARRLPAFATAYPRRSKSFADPERGLASVEALYAALALLGDKRPELLLSYRWREEFLRLNPALA